MPRSAVRAVAAVAGVASVAAWAVAAVVLAFTERPSCSSQTTLTWILLAAAVAATPLCAAAAVADRDWRWWPTLAALGATAVWVGAFVALQLIDANACGVPGS